MQTTKKRIVGEIETRRRGSWGDLGDQANGGQMQHSPYEYGAANGWGVVGLSSGSIQCCQSGLVFFVTLPLSLPYCTVKQGAVGSGPVCWSGLVLVETTRLVVPVVLGDGLSVSLPPLHPRAQWPLIRSKWADVSGFRHGSEP